MKKEIEILDKVNNNNENENLEIMRYDIKPDTKEQIDFSFKQKVKRQVEYKAYAHYFYNDKHLESTIFPIPVITNNFRLKSTQETFSLGKASYYLNGKPVYVLVRKIPFSIPFRLRYSKRYKMVLQDKGYTSDQIDAILNSIHVNHIFRAKRLTTQDLLLWLLSILCSVLITAMTFTIFME